MNPPKKIKIGPWRFEIVVDEATMNKTRMQEENGEAIGFTCASTQTILLDPDLAPDMMADTLLHEIFHAIFYAVGGKNLYDFDEEEKIVSLFSTMLLDVLRSNPALTKYLTGK